MDLSIFIPPKISCGHGQMYFTMHMASYKAATLFHNFLTTYTWGLVPIKNTSNVIEIHSFIKNITNNT
jgi:hypothetical protein